MTLGLTWVIAGWVAGWVGHRSMADDDPLRLSIAPPDGSLIADRTAAHRDRAAAHRDRADDISACIRQM